MSSKIKIAFLILVIIQTFHSIEEYTNKLYMVFKPAKVVSLLFSSDPLTGFVIVNTLIILSGFFCYFVFINRDHITSKFWITAGGIIEFGNGLGHIMISIVRHSYFPGIITAVPLLLVSVYVLYQAIQVSNTSSASR